MSRYFECFSPVFVRRISHTPERSWENCRALLSCGDYRTLFPTTYLRNVSLLVVPFFPCVNELNGVHAADEHVLFVAPTAQQIKMYSHILNLPRTREVFDGSGSQHLVLISTLKKLCNTPGLLKQEHEKVRRACCVKPSKSQYSRCLRSLQSLSAGKGENSFVAEAMALYPSNRDPVDITLSGKKKSRIFIKLLV